MGRNKWSLGNLGAPFSWLYECAPRCAGGLGNCLLHSRRWLLYVNVLAVVSENTKETFPALSVYPENNGKAKTNISTLRNTPHYFELGYCWWSLETHFSHLKGTVKRKLAEGVEKILLRGATISSYCTRSSAWSTIFPRKLRAAAYLFFFVYATFVFIILEVSFKKTICAKTQSSLRLLCYWNATASYETKWEIL